jgi:hypothetical protein
MDYLAVDEFLSREAASGAFNQNLFIAEARRAPRKNSDPNDF